MMICQQEQCILLNFRPAEQREAAPHLDQVGVVGHEGARGSEVNNAPRGWGGIADKVLEPPSELFERHVYGCFFDDPHGHQNLDAIGVDNVTYESDYPHSDSTWPNTAKIATEQMSHLSDEVVYKLVRGNAIKMLHIDHLK